MLRTLLATSVALLLTACGPSTPFLPKTEPLVLPELPENLRGCARLQPVTARAGSRTELSVDEMRVLWGEDRVVAAQCHRRLKAVVVFYDDLRAGLMQPDL
jgi:hypothetical protein